MSDYKYEGILNIDASNPDEIRKFFKSIDAEDKKNTEPKKDIKTTPKEKEIKKKKSFDDTKSQYKSEIRKEKQQSKLKKQEEIKRKKELAELKRREKQQKKEEWQAIKKIQKANRKEREDAYSLKKALVASLIAGPIVGTAVGIGTYNYLQYDEEFQREKYEYEERIKKAEIQRSYLSYGKNNPNYYDEYGNKIKTEETTEIEYDDGR